MTARSASSTASPALNEAIGRVDSPLHVLRGRVVAPRLPGSVLSGLPLSPLLDLSIPPLPLLKRTKW